MKGKSKMESQPLDSVVFNPLRFTLTYSNHALLEILFGKSLEEQRRVIEK